MKQYKLFEELVTIEFNKIIERYAGHKELKTYAIGWREYNPGENYAIGNNHGECCYTLEVFIHIADVCNLDYYFTIGEDADGNPTPILRVF